MSNLESSAGSGQDTEDVTGPAEILLSDLAGLTDLEQFLRVFSAPKQGARLWAQWYEASNDTGKGVLNHLAEQSAQENNMPLEEAQRLLAAEKYLNDRGPDYAVRYMKVYRTRLLQENKPLQPMKPKAKKK